MKSLIVFLGPVGVGKSTQVNLLAKNLKKRGFSVSCTQLKAFHILSSFLILVLLFLVREKTQKNHYRILREKRALLGARVMTILTFLDIPSFLVRYLLTVSWQRKLRDVVIVEEYIPAAVAEYLFWWKIMGKKNQLSSIFINFIQRLFNRNEATTIVFYLDGTSSKLLKRIAARNTYTEQLDYIKMQRSTLLTITQNFSSADRFHYIDTSSRNIVAVEKAILTTVNNELGVESS